MLWLSGDVFWSPGNFAPGAVYVFRKTGTGPFNGWDLVDALVHDDPTDEFVGSRFLADGSFAATSFPFATQGRVVVWPKDWDHIAPAPVGWGTGGTTRAESVAQLPNGGDLLIGLGRPVAGGALPRYTQAGVLVQTYSPLATEHSNVDCIDLAPDGHTVFYTSGDTGLGDGRLIKRYDLQSGTQLADFATLAPETGACVFSIRCLPDGGCLVADRTNIKRLSAAGAVTQTYVTGNPLSDGDLYALTLDPSGTSFWTGGYDIGMVYQIRLSDGVVLDQIDFAGGSTGLATAGLSVYGGVSSGPPLVDAGPDQTVTFPATAILDGTVLPGGCSGGTVTQLWTKVSGPGSTTFADATLADTDVYFSEGGTYVLRLTATCTVGGLTASDTVTITVNGPPAFSGPSVAGPGMERFLAFSRLNDEGDPAPYATVRVYLTGTPTLANIYESNDLGDPKSNPFTTGEDGLAAFYAANGRYDVRFSGGTVPGGAPGEAIATPWAFGDWLLDDPEDAVVVGPTGPQGPAGPTGATGAQGPAGTSAVAAAAAVYRSTDFSLADTTPTLVTPDVATVNDGFWTVGTKLIVPAAMAGDYLAVGQATWQGGFVGLGWVSILVNGAERARATLGTTNAAPPYLAPVSVSCFVRLAVGDYVELQVEQQANVPGTAYTIKGGAAKTFLQVARMA